ncbi:hypothetical protein DVH24_020732 [Malus domestica]|uniref:Uncharacterized protein n=1 Tax=Malus domestica TaxID=3750 RepID=A0A498J7F0_MALDO|nr:hypothetical protein DVH24_020732 [Malus domestica]
MKTFQNKTHLSLPCAGAFSLPPFILSSFPSPSREATLGIWMSTASTLASAPPSLSAATSRLSSSTGEADSGLDRLWRKKKTDILSHDPTIRGDSIPFHQ